MPEKSRHGKAKYHTKKSKAKQRSTALPSQQQAVGMSPKPAVATSVSTLPEKKVRTTEKIRTATVAGAVRYPYITAELKRIGILAGIILVILIVLALVLP